MAETTATTGTNGQTSGNGENSTQNVNTGANQGTNQTQSQNANSSANNSSGGNVNNNTKSGNQSTDIERLIQSAVDRATQRLGTDNRELREQLEALQQQNMSEAEKHTAAIQKRERDVARREAELKAEKNRMYALTAIKNAHLDDGGTTALELVDLVMADDEAGIDERTKTLETLVNSLVQAQVDKTFKANGRKPDGGNGSGADNDKGKDKTEFARALGQRAAAENQRARDILNQYIK